MLASAIRVSRWTKSLHDASFAGPICRPLQAQPFQLISGFTLGNRQTQTVSSESANTQMDYSTTVKQPLKSDSSRCPRNQPACFLSLSLWFWPYGSWGVDFCINMSRWTKSLQDASFAGPICRPLQALPFSIEFWVFPLWW